MFPAIFFRNKLVTTSNKLLLKVKQEKTILEAQPIFEHKDLLYGKLKSCVRGTVAMKLALEQIISLFKV